MIKKKYGQDATNVGDEGGFAPNIQVRSLDILLAFGYLKTFFSFPNPSMLLTFYFNLLEF